MFRRCALALLMSLEVGVAAAQDVRAISIPREVPFSTDAFVAQNVRLDCDLPGRQAADLQEELAAHGWNVEVREDDVTSSAGLSLKLEISGVSSSRAADIVSHHQGVIVNAKLFSGKTVVGDLVASRTSKGGVFGVFRSSCGVLYKCTKANAADIAKWLDSPSVKAKLSGEE